MSEDNSPNVLDDEIDRHTFNHYHTYMKIYGYLIMQLADDKAEVIKLMNGECDNLLMIGLRKRIEDSPVYEVN